MKQEGDDWTVTTAQDEVLVAIAWHSVGDEDGGPEDARTFLDEDGETVLDLNEVVVGVFTSERLARVGAETYAKEHNALIDSGHAPGSGRVRTVSLNRAGFNVHGTGSWIDSFNALDGIWESSTRK